MGNEQLLTGLEALVEHEKKDSTLVPSGELVAYCRSLTRLLEKNRLQTAGYNLHLAMEAFHHGKKDLHAYVNLNHQPASVERMTHLDRLEAESIHIIREVIAQADNPVMLYSVGKDSAVMLQLARKAFLPESATLPTFACRHSLEVPSHV